MKTPIVYDAEKHLIVDSDGFAIGHVSPSTGPEIVAACNAHKPMLEALGRARKNLLVAMREAINLEGFDPSEHIVIKQIDAALALAKGGTP